ncbi:hypothetical protein LX36DRAFT_182854 [Colletotrichum falcatum]|nr:hypothetical protein LX36DRAFT_182854 [Colletotrichum falcatum]
MFDFDGTDRLSGAFCPEFALIAAQQTICLYHGERGQVDGVAMTGVSSHTAMVAFLLPAASSLAFATPTYVLVLINWYKLVTCR